MSCDFIETTDSNIDSNADELLMLEQLAINEKEVIGNTKDLKQKRFIYQQSIRELNEELNSQESLSETIELNSCQLENNENTKLQQSTNNNFFNLPQKNQSQSQITLKDTNNQLSNSNSILTNNYQIPSFLIPNKNATQQISYSNNFSKNYDKDMLKYITEYEEFIQNKLNEADSLFESLNNNT